MNTNEHLMANVELSSGPSPNRVLSRVGGHFALGLTIAVTGLSAHSLVAPTHARAQDPEVPTCPTGYHPVESHQDIESAGVTCDKDEETSTPPPHSTNTNHTADHTTKPHHPKPNFLPSDEWKFDGYEMGARPLTDGNGCFISSTSSAFRRVTGNEDIQPKSVYKVQAVKDRWSPGGGVKKWAFMADALPAIAKHFETDSYKIQVKRVGYKGARQALKRYGQVIILAAPGPFAGGSGHYMVGRKSLSNGNILLDDPNGKGKSGDSERSKGWSKNELAQRRVIGYFAITLKRKNKE